MYQAKRKGGNDIVSVPAGTGAIPAAVEDAEEHTGAHRLALPTDLTDPSTDPAWVLPEGT
jgi:hypothetical protein